MELVIQPSAQTLDHNVRGAFRVFSSVFSMRSKRHYS